MKIWKFQAEKLSKSKIDLASLFFTPYCIYDVVFDVCRGMNYTDLNLSWYSYKYYKNTHTLHLLPWCLIFFPKIYEHFGRFQPIFEKKKNYNCQLSITSDKLYIMHCLATGATHVRNAFYLNAECIEHSWYYVFASIQLVECSCYNIIEYTSLFTSDKTRYFYVIECFICRCIVWDYDDCYDCNQWQIAQHNTKACTVHMCTMAKVSTYNATHRQHPTQAHRSS